MGKLSGGGRAKPGWVAAAIAGMALFVALGGGVYAATEDRSRKIDGHRVRAGTLPGNRLIPGSVPGNRLRAGSIPASKLAPGSVTGAQIDVATLGQVPSAAHAGSADRAGEAARSLRAESAANADRVNGFSAGCAEGTRQFAGACWEREHSLVARKVEDAATFCALRGGELPGALALAAFAQQPGVVLAVGGEWSNSLFTYTGVDEYSVATVSASAKIGAAPSTAERKFRCVTPLVG